MPARLAVALLLVVATTLTADADRRGRTRAPTLGFTARIGGGANVLDPYLELQLGRRFTRAPWFELYLDYSYNWPISEFSFHTFGVGARTMLVRGRHAQLFHQSLLAFAVSSSGDGPVTDRELGERLLGAFVTQGLGVAWQLAPRWTMSLAASTGYPVWLRSDVSVGVTF